MQSQSTTSMNTLAACINKLVADGYTGNFSVDEKGLVTEGDKHYKPDQVHIKNFFRFEGASDPVGTSTLIPLCISKNK